MANLGEFVQEEQCEYREAEHIFSDRYERRKKRLLNSLESPVEKRWRMSRPAAACACLALAAALSGSVYAAVKLLHTEVAYDKDSGKATVTRELTDDAYIPPIRITPEYLPDGYEEWEEGKYSYEGEYAGTGLSILDVSGTKIEYIRDAGSYETKELDGKTAYIFTREGYEYSHIVFLAYEDTGHTVMIYASQDISMEELIKVCENMAITEVPEEDPDHTFKAYTYDPLEEEGIDHEAAAVQESSVIHMGESFREIFTGDSDADIRVTITDMKISDKVDMSKLNENTTSDYEETLEFLGEDGVLPDYTFTASYWDSAEEGLVNKEIGIYPVKYVEVTAVLENLSGTDADDVNVQPQFLNLSKLDDGSGYEVKKWEESMVDMNEDYRGCSSYKLACDNVAFYFDASAYPGEPHFYNTSLAAGETKTVHMGFAVPEPALKNLCLGYDRDSDQPKYVRLEATEETD